MLWRNNGLIGYREIMDIEGMEKLWANRLRRNDGSTGYGEMMAPQVNGNNGCIAYVLSTDEI